MKVINFILQLFIITILSGILIFWFTGFRSAFEADQSCHSLLKSYKDIDNYGCDHDTETHQWILYEDKDQINPAKVIKRFRYKFL